ncbi:MAG TPA: BA14K family protein [Pseudorhizobium sp.]|nr:BA14K family protein [Pseudorhizobium sp.]
MQIKARTLAATLLGAAMSLTSIAPAQALVMPSMKGYGVSPIQEVQYRRDRDRDYRNRDRDRRGYYRGHRGSREQRRGYRRHSDGWWYPLAAFGAGAVIGGAIQEQNQGQRARGHSSRHVQWCDNRYRTYRASDNSYVPRVGVRAQCQSPYSR